MTASFLVTFDEQWRIARLANGQVVLRDVPPADDGGKSLRSALHDLGYDKGGVCLGLASQQVISARIDGKALPNRNRRTAMLCLLEEQLPLDIESMTADFLPPAGGAVMGVAVESDAADGWNAEIVLTYLIYDPLQAGK